MNFYKFMNFTFIFNQNFPYLIYHIILINLTLNFKIQKFYPKVECYINEKFI